MTDTRVCLDLFAGLGGFSAAFADADGWDVVTVDIEGRFDPDIQADVLDLRHGDLPDPDLVLASPPCTAFSMAASGTHIGPEGEPVSDWGATSIQLVHHTVGLIRALDPDHHVIENPMGGMRRELGHPDAHVWWCQYGSDRAKPTDLWGDLPRAFEPKRCYPQADDCDHERAPRGSHNGTQSNDLDAPDRAKIPDDLSAAIRDAIDAEAAQTTLAEVDP